MSITLEIRSRRWIFSATQAAQPWFDGWLAANFFFGHTLSVDARRGRNIALSLRAEGWELQPAGVIEANELTQIVSGRPHHR